MEAHLEPQPFLYGSTLPDHLTLRTTSAHIWKYTARPSHTWNHSHSCMEINTSLDILSKIITRTSEENVSKLRGCNFIRWWCPLHSWGGTDRLTLITHWALLSQSGKERNVCNAAILLFRFLWTVPILPFSFADKLPPFSLFCGKTYFF